MHVTDGTTSGTPCISVIIPTCNRPEKLSRCLAACAQQTYPKSLFEVIVVDDGSDSPPHDVMMQASAAMDVRLVRQTNQGPAAARNFAAQQACGKLLAFTDDDCRPCPDWLAVFAGRFEGMPDTVFGGQTKNELVENPYSVTSQLIVDAVYAHYNADPDHAELFASNNLAVPRHVFHAVGGFDPCFRTSEDRDLCDRLSCAGYRLQYVPEATVYHTHALSVARFLRQHFNYGRGACRYHRTRKKRKSAARRSAIKFNANLHRWLPARSKEDNANCSLAAIIFLLLCWQVANTSGFLWEWLSRTKNHGEEKYHE